MNEHTSAAGNDIGTLIEDARALMAATADVTGDKVNEARKRLAAALDKSREACEHVHVKALEGVKSAGKAVQDHPYEAVALGVGLGVGAGALLGFLVARAFPCHRN